jgi:hypothetical protein
MNLARHVAVLWRFRAVTAAGLLLGLTLAVLASYQPTFAGGPSLTARGASTFNSESQILVTQAGFPEGRVTLPDAPILNSGSTADPKTKVDPNRFEYADPARFMALADLYTQLLTSDQVRSFIPEHPKPSQITASALPATSGAPILPIISLITTAPTAAEAHNVNVNAIKALRELLKSQQEKAGILPAQRIRLDTLKESSPGQLVAGPSHTGSLLAFVLMMILTIAATHLLASIRGLPGDNDAARDAEETEPAPEFEAGGRLAAVGGGAPSRSPNRGGPSDPGYWGAR